MHTFDPWRLPCLSSDIIETQKLQLFSKKTPRKVNQLFFKFLENPKPKQFKYLLVVK